MLYYFLAGQKPSPNAHEADHAIQHGRNGSRLTAHHNCARYYSAAKLHKPSRRCAGGLGGTAHGPPLVKSKNSVMSGMEASRAVSAAKLNRVSTNFRNAV